LKKLSAALLRKGTGVHIASVSQSLRYQFGLKSYKPVRKSKLTPLMKSKRLEFAEEHQAWTSEEWSKVMFLNEYTL